MDMKRFFLYCNRNCRLDVGRMWRQRRWYGWHTPTEPTQPDGTGDATGRNPLPPTPEEMALRDAQDAAMMAANGGDGGSGRGRQGLRGGATRRSTRTWPRSANTAAGGHDFGDGRRVPDGGRDGPQPGAWKRPDTMRSLGIIHVVNKTQSIMQ